MPRIRVSSLLALCAAGAFANTVAAQETPPTAVVEPPPVAAGLPAHAIYIEAGGLPAFEGGPYTLNVEQRLLPATYLRLGVFYGPVDAKLTMKVPVLLSYVTPGASHNLEVGAGIRWDVSGASADDVRLAATAGYRYHELPGHALLRAGLSFDLHSLAGKGSDAWTFGPWPYLSIGLGF